MRAMDSDIDTLRAFFAGAPFMAHLGVAPVDSSAGRLVTQLALQAHHLQHSGVVHAGVIGALADHTMGAAAQTMTGQLILTAEFKLSLLRGARGQRRPRVLCDDCPHRAPTCHSTSRT